MIRYQVEIGAQAQTDLTEIIRYIGLTLQEPRTAGNMYRLLKEGILSLRQMPERHPYEEDDRLRALGIRKMRVKNYKILYFADMERKRVQIVRVVYTGRDITKIVDETTLDGL